MDLAARPLDRMIVPDTTCEIVRPRAAAMDEHTETVFVYEKRKAEFGSMEWWAPITMRGLNSLGNELREAGRWEDALAVYGLNARRHPGHWRVWYSLGRAYKEKGQVEQAVGHYRKALEVDPFNNLAPLRHQAVEELQNATAQGE